MVWRQHPTEIEAELADRGHDIMDWHRGAMSSRKLLVLLKHPRENGPYAAALRGGDWPDWVKMLAETHKELALYRAAKYADSPHQYEPLVFVSPVERRERHQQQVEVSQEIEEDEEEFYTEMGWG